MCANNIEQDFIKIKEWNTLESNSLSLVESSLWAQALATWFYLRGWEVCLGLGWTMVEVVNEVTMGTTGGEFASVEWTRAEKRNEVTT